MISLATADGGIICFTLVVPEIREYLIAEAEKANVLYYDIIGPLIDKMETAYGLTAKYEPGRVRQLDEDYFKKWRPSSLQLNTMMDGIQEGF